MKIDIVILLVLAVEDDGCTNDYQGVSTISENQYGTISDNYKYENL